VVVCPTWFAALPEETAALMTGEGRALDPREYFIVVPGHFGAGASSSPSNTPAPFDRGRFPYVTTYDSVRAQHRLLTEKFGVTEIRLVASWSAGGNQSYAWAALYPEMVRAIGPICGGARTAANNKVFIEANVRALVTDPAFRNGFYGDAPPLTGVRTMAAIYSGWGFSEPFYRMELFREFGANSPEEFIEIFWEPFFLKCDVNDMLAQIWTWKHNNIGDHPRFGGDFDAALGTITARAILMPAETDQYFPPADSRYEAGLMPDAEVRPIPTVWGHMAPLNPADQAFIDRNLKELLAG
jgi:homoserine O-acetyltransferase